MKYAIGIGGGTKPWGSWRIGMAALVMSASAGGTTIRFAASTVVSYRGLAVCCVAV